MRLASVMVILFLASPVIGAELESRVLTHYVPQDFLETVVRTEGWTELKLAIKGGIRKGDVVRIWTGGSIDYGNGDQPGQNISAPSGLGSPLANLEPRQLALSPDSAHAFSLLVKTEGKALKKCAKAGKPLEIEGVQIEVASLDHLIAMKEASARTKDKLMATEYRVLSDELRGRYQDNHLGRGRQHELDPLWMRIEVIRIIID